MTKRTTCYYEMLTDCTNTTTDMHCSQRSKRLIGGVIETLRPAAVKELREVEETKTDAIRKPHRISLRC